jgi:hypothetical protein
MSLFAVKEEKCIMWMVQLAGDSSDLAAFAQSLTGGDINISHDGQDCVLASDKFADNDEAGAVRQKAEALVTVLNGASTPGTRYCPINPSWSRVSPA